LLKEGTQKCIFDDIPKNQVVIGHYNVMDQIGAEKTDGVEVQVTW
jgi:hypothetical protein